LNLPVRLRWQTPLGHVTEVTETLDVSRGGLLFFRHEACPIHATLWVTFPYDQKTDSVPKLRDAQPETLARVVRVKRTPSGGHLVAVRFETQQYSPAPAPEASGPENRRAHARVPMALPIQVRYAGSPWPEETMSADLSSEGVRFRTARTYLPGQPVELEVPHGRWAGRKLLGHVLRTEPVPGSVEHYVAVRIEGDRKNSHSR
jgi:hypothetical protein